MRGSKTGVYIGVSGSEAAEAFSRDPEELLGYSMTGCQHAMLANRLSYFFDFTGMHTLILKSYYIKQYRMINSVMRCLYIKLPIIQ